MVPWATDRAGIEVHQRIERAFGDALTDYFWEYDNNRLKLARLRFYQDLPTTLVCRQARPHTD